MRFSRLGCQDPEPDDEANATRAPPPKVRPNRADEGTCRDNILIRRAVNITGIGTIVTMDSLTKALTKRLEAEPAQAKGLAYRVLNYFGYSDTIIDNLVDQEDRKLFYQLHDAGLLRSTWETTLLLSGKAWRIFYWQLNLEEIRKVSDEGGAVEGEEPVYDNLPEDAWSHATAT